LTPSTADPVQQKIFMFMPILFTFLFITFPAGLVLYWTVNNLLTIAQQYYIYHIAKD
jgi:YidC/Oxa1 family membrane protein insertase